MDYSISIVKIELQILLDRIFKYLLPPGLQKPVANEQVILESENEN